MNSESAQQYQATESTTTLFDGYNVSHLQKFLPAYLIILSLWVAFGRVFFGLGGWGILLSIFMILPALLGYMLVISVILYIKSRKLYLMSKIVRYIFIAILVCMFVAGLTLVDGGDTVESVNSILTFLTGANHGSTDNMMFEISEGLTAASMIVGSALIMISIIVLAIDKGEKLSISTPPSDVKGTVIKG